jgi:hypothetical protein
LSALGALLIAVNTERFVESRGWDLLLRNAIDTEGGLPVYGLISNPWLIICAMVIIAFTGGMWAESLLRRREITQLSSDEMYSALGANALALSGRITVALDRYVPGTATPLLAEVVSQMVSFEKHGFRVPTVTTNLPKQIMLKRAGHYFLCVGRLLNDGHFWKRRKQLPSSRMRFRYPVDRGRCHSRESA